MNFTDSDPLENEKEPIKKLNDNHPKPYIVLPRIISIKKDAFFDLPEFLSQLRAGRDGLCICDSLTKEIAGRKVEEVVVSSNFTLDFYEISDADIPTVKEVEKYIKTKGFDFIIGVGGGRAIDVAKITSFHTANFFISVPTAPSHDGVASNIASIRSNKGFISMKAHPPHCVVADINIIATAPHRLVASGCADVISNMTAILDWKLGRDTKNENYSRYASAISQMSYNILKRNIKLVKPNSVAGVHLVMDALVASGMAMSIYGNSRPASGGEHLISHALDRIAKTPALHGEQCGVATIFTMYLHEGDWKEVRRLLSTVGAPVNLEQLGVTKEEFIKAVQLAPRIRPNRFTILHQNLAKERIEKVLEETMLI